MEPSSQPPPRHPRRIRLIRPSLQLRLIGIFAGIALLALLLEILALGAMLTETAAGLPTSGDEIMGQLPTILGKAFLVSLLMVVPAMLLIGVRVTFRIAGPVYRFEQHLGAVARGEEMGPCRIRDGDQFQELCELINSALAAERERGAREATADEPEQVAA